MYHERVREQTRNVCTVSTKGNSTDEQICNELAASKEAEWG